MLRWIVYTVLVAAAVACHEITENPTAPPMTDPGRVMLSSVSVVWLPNVDEVNKACPPEPGRISYACAIVKLAGDGLTSTCAIYAIRPTDFNDQPKIGILGHEFFHCLGARHG